jgi:sulfide:quinone oxidoreductase
VSKAVVIAGGGPAALEAAMVLRRLGGDRVSTTLLTPETHLTYRPLSVLEPFADATPVRYELARIASDQTLSVRAGRLSGVDCAEHTAILDGGGERLRYDMLLLATGALMTAPFGNALVFGRGRRDIGALRGLARDMASGYVRRVAFVVPAGCTWPLPLYELALMFARRGFDAPIPLEIDLITPEREPLDVFGAPASAEVAALIEQASIRLHRGTVASPVNARTLRFADGHQIEIDRIVTLALPRGPRVFGVPCDRDGFVPCDQHGRVPGVPDVYAAGDVTSFPIKQGGLACQQADAAAESIAAAAGARIEPQPFTPVLRGVLLTEAWSRFLRREGDHSEGVIAERALWWPPAKIAGRELARYLELLDEQAGRRTLAGAAKDRAGTPVTLSPSPGKRRPSELLAPFGARG